MNLLVRMEVVVLSPAGVEALARRHWTGPAQLLHALCGARTGGKRADEARLTIESSVTRQEILQRFEAASGGVRAGIADVMRAMEDAGVEVILVPAVRHVKAALPVLERAVVSVQGVARVDERVSAESLLVGVWPSTGDVARMAPLVRPHIPGAHSALAQAAEALGVDVLPVLLRATSVVARALRVLAVAVAYAIGGSACVGVGVESSMLRIAAARAALRDISTTVWGDAFAESEDALLVAAFLDFVLDAPAGPAGQQARREIFHMIDALIIRDGCVWSWPATLGLGHALGVCIDLARAYDAQCAERALRTKHTAQASERSEE